MYCSFYYKYIIYHILPITLYSKNQFTTRYYVELMTCLIFQVKPVVAYNWQAFLLTCAYISETDHILNGWLFLETNKNPPSIYPSDIDSHLNS